MERLLKKFRFLKSRNRGEGKMKRKTVLLVATVVVLLVGSMIGSQFAGFTSAAPGDSVSIPKVINYQGLLTDKDTGESIAGTVDIVFSLYISANVSEAPTPIWEETHSGVTLDNGLFNVILGSINPLSADNFTGARYLGIKVGADEEMTPRQILTSVPYAFQAENANTIEGYTVSTLPIEWANLENVPPGFADGVDNDTTYTAGTSLVLVGTQFSLVASIESDIADNAADITVNAANITVNAANIAANVVNIAANTANITANAAEIATNQVDIANLQNVKQLIHDFVVASGENVTAGDVVTFLDGYVQKGFPAGSEIDYSSEYVFKSDNTFYLSASALSSTKFVVAYNDVANSQYGTAIIGDVTGSTITYGSEYVFNSDSTFPISVTAFSSTKFVVAYKDVGNSNYGTAIIGDVSGSTITYGSEYVFNSGATPSFSATALSSTKFVVTYQDSGNLEYGTAIIGDVTGSIITYGSEYVFNSGAAAFVSATTLSSTKFVVAYTDGGNSNYGTAIIGDVSGSTITYGSEYVFNPAQAVSNTATALSSTKFVVTYRDVPSSNYGTAIIGNVSGSTITYGSEYVFNPGSTNYISAAALSPSSFVVTYQDVPNSGYGTAIIGDVSGSTITYGSEYVFNLSNTTYISTTALSSTNFVVTYQDVGNSNYGTASIGYAYDSNFNIVGIAGESGAEAETVPLIIGGVSDAHSGLTLGELYYATVSGELTTGVTDHKIGLAISESEILLSMQVP